MSDETKGKLSFAVAGGFTLLGVVLAVGTMFIRQLLVKPAPAVASKHAKIRLLDFTPSPSDPNVGTGTCEFKVNHGANDVSYKFPVLSISTGDTIDWIGKDGRSGNHHDPPNLTVNFTNSSAGSPFYPSSKFVSTGSPVASGPITTTTYGDYAYADIVFLTDDGKTAHCSNATDPGVHVDQ